MCDFCCRVQSEEEEWRQQVSMEIDMKSERSDTILRERTKSVQKVKRSHGGGYLKNPQEAPRPYGGWVHLRPRSLVSLVSYKRE